MTEEAGASHIPEFDYGLSVDFWTFLLPLSVGCAELLDLCMISLVPKILISTVMVGSEQSLPTLEKL